jgi:hypothetical protein
LLGATAALFCDEAPKPLNILLAAAVLELLWGAEDVAPKLKGAGAGADVPEAFGAGLAVPNKFDEGALLLVPNIPPVPAVLVLFCDWPPKGLPNCCPPKPPNAGVDPLPFVMGEDAEKGLLAPAVKLKLVAGGCGLKPVLWLPAPNAGKEELTKELLGADDWAGGKLLVAPPPNALLPPKPMPFVLFVLLFVGAGAVAPKLMPPSDAPKFALWDGVCVRSLAFCCSCLRRISRRPAAVYLFVDMLGAALCDVGLRLQLNAGMRACWGVTHGRSACGSP